MLLLLIAVMILVPTSDGIRAQTLVYEPFAYSAGTVLDGYPPTGLNLTGTWDSFYQNPTPNQTLQVVAPGLDYGNLGNAPIPTANRVGGVTADGTVEVDQDVILGPGDTLFFSALFRVDNSSVSGNLANITLNNATTGGLIELGLDRVSIYISADTPTAFGVSSVPFSLADGDVLFFVGRYVESATPGGDQLDLLVYDTADAITLPGIYDPADPNSGFPLTLPPGFDIDLGRVSAISVNARGFSADEIRVGRAYADVVGNAPAVVSLGPCGDVDGNRAVTTDDLALLRAHLADPVGAPLGVVGEARCRVHPDSVGCDLLSSVVLARRLGVPLLGPGIQPACSDVTPLDLGVNLSSHVDTQIVDAVGGELEVTGDDGTRYRLVLPTGAVTQIGGVEVTMRAIASIDGYGGSGGFLGGVQLEPDGLMLATPGVLHVELATPRPAANVAALGYAGTGGEAGFLPVRLDTIGPVASIAIPITHFSGAAAVGASADEVASTPPPVTAPTAQDAPYMQRLATLLQLGIEEGLAGAAFDQDADAQASVLEAMRDWLAGLGSRAAANLDSCTDVNETFRAFNGWSIQDQLFGTVLEESLDPGDQAKWLALKNAIMQTDEILNQRYAAGESFCASHAMDHCARYVERNDVINCQLVADFLFQRFDLEPTMNDPLSLCPDTPSEMVFQRTDLVENGPFELCPLDDFFTITATVQDQDGYPFVIPEPFDWSSSDPGILSLTPYGDYATATPAGGLGKAVITAEWPSCPEFPASTNAFVGIAPRLVGIWIAEGTVYQIDCEDPSENFPPTSGAELGEIEAQITNPDGTVTFNTFGPGWEGVATLECGTDPSYAGSDTYFFEGGYGVNTYSGSLTATSGPPGARAAIGMTWNWEAQDMAGDTCYAAGSGTLSRVGE